jgi:hypothetical protein
MDSHDSANAPKLARTGQGPLAGQILDVSPTVDNTTITGGAATQSATGRMLALANAVFTNTVFAGSFSNL